MNPNTGLFIAVAILALLVGRRSRHAWERAIPLGLLALLLVAAPKFSDNISVLTPVFIGALLGAGWNIIGGYTGYGSFGQVAFFGAGAYAMAASIATTGHFFGLHPALGMLIASLVAGLYALVIGLPILRLRGHYFAIATLTFGIATQQLIKNIDWLGGSSGISTPIIRSQNFLWMEVNRDQYFYFIGLTLMALAVTLTWVISQSKFGYGLQAIRENEDAAACMGIDTNRYKLEAFVVAAMITGIAGALQAYLRSGVSPEDDGVFQLRFNLLPLIIPLIGGVGTVRGPVIGAFLFFGMEHVLTNASGSSTFVQDWERVITGAIIVVVVLLLPRGLGQLVGTRGPRGWRVFAYNLRATRV